MKEEEIRPEELMRENIRLHFRDAKYMLKSKKTFKRVPCPACGSVRHRESFNKGGFIFVSCFACETLYVNPRPSFEMLKEFYASSKSIKHWNDRIFPASEKTRRSGIFAPRARAVSELCRRHKTRPGTLLDVGAGFGTFCEEVIRLNAFDHVIAVEPSRELADTCRQKGLKVIEKPIEEVRLGGIDVITCFELIEHLYEPMGFIKACRRVLPKGGLLILTTPNIMGFDLAVLGRISDNIAAPNHLNYFHPGSASRLLNRCGFEITEISTPGKLDADIVRNKIASGEFDISGQRFLKNILVDRWEEVGRGFQEFLADNKLSSHLWVTARRA